MRNNSEYTYQLFWVLTLSTGVTALFFLLATAAVAVVARRLALSSPWVPRIISALLIVSCSFSALMLAIISGFEYIPPEMVLVILCLSWAALSMLSFFLHTRTARNTLVSGRTWRQILTMAVRGSVEAAMRRPRYFSMICFAGYCVSFVLVLSLCDVCYCNNPTEVTTWVSRRNQAHFCEKEKYCHLYVLLGYNSSTVRVVGHITSDYGIPVAAAAQVCTVSCATNQSRTFQARIIDASDSSGEDPRYVAQYTLTGLLGDTVYTAEVSFLLGSGAVAERVISFRTVPDISSTSNVQFISGGDLFTGYGGQEYLLTGLTQSTNPSFIFFGGDLAYANNNRACYLRFDNFLAVLTSMRSQDGLSIPYVLIPGNHESGGYLPEPSWSDYNFFLPFFPQFDSPVAAPGNVTYHTHVVGGVTLVALDSGLMTPVTDQVGYLKDMLRQHHELGQVLVVAYHNGMYPSVRSFDNVNAVAVRGAFGPLLDDYCVALALEFHDHAYKRTLRLHRGAVVPTSACGTLFIGDGGVGLNRPATNGEWYLNATFTESHIEVVNLVGRGSLLVRSVTAGGQLLDTSVTDQY